MSGPVVVGYDPKVCDRAPVEFGVATAGLTGAPVLIVSVYGGAVGGLRARQLREDLLEDATATVTPEDVRNSLHVQGIDVGCRDVASTSAPRALHEVAEEEDAALLVVGSTHRGAVGRVLPGSTADRLMHGAPCPVAVVPHDWARGGGLATVGVAYVDTDEGREALRAAHAFARRVGADLRVLTVVGLHGHWHGETKPTTPPTPGKDFEDVVGEHRVMAEAAARGAVAELEDGVAVDVDALVGDPADSLISVSQGLDLLICGSRGYGPARAVLLGGVSRRVTAEAHCPVIVLPRGAHTPLDAILVDTAVSAAES